jgi:putative Mg2+ transporter-C (MgtC) family protein
MNELSHTEIAIRLALTLFTSMAIGLDRESHGRAAGLRTTMLVGLASAIAMIVSNELFMKSASPDWHPDPARLAAGILTGMGFLGGGVIIHEGNVIRGVTTAAVLWFVAIMGLAFGCGEYFVGIVGWAVAFLTLTVVPKLENFIKNDWYGSVIIRAHLEGITEDEIRRRLEHHHGLRIKQVELSYDLELQERRIKLELKFKRQDPLKLSKQVVDDLRTGTGVKELRWE